MVIIFEILVSIKVPVGTNSRRSSRGVSQQSQEEQMRRSMSLASQQEAPTRYQEEENPYNHQPSEMNGRRVSEANYPAQNRYDRSNNVRINNFQYFYLAGNIHKSSKDWGKHTMANLIWIFCHFLD